jgi:hypothetical protein
MFNRIFNFGNNKPVEPAVVEPVPTILDIAVRFHKDVNGYSEHGSIYASHAQMNLTNEPIRFGFVDVDAPVLTPDVMAHIWDLAERQGFIVHSLRSYVDIFPVQPKPRSSVSTPRPNNNSDEKRTGIARGLRRPSGERARSVAAA